MDRRQSLNSEITNPSKPFKFLTNGNRITIQQTESKIHHGGPKKKKKKGIILLKKTHNKLLHLTMKSLKEKGILYDDRNINFRRI
jgi:hypothetical protein